MEVWGEEVRAVMAGATSAVASVFGALVCTTLQILAALERQVRTPPFRPCRRAQPGRVQDVPFG